MEYCYYIIYKVGGNEMQKINEILINMGNDNLIYRIKKKLNDNLLLCGMYYTIPWIAVTVLYFIMYFSPARVASEKQLSFFYDYANSIGCTTLFLVIYYISGIYPKVLQEAFSKENIVSPNSENKSLFSKYISYFKKEGEIFLRLHKHSWKASIVFSIFFVGIAMKNGEGYWFNKLPFLGKLYYWGFLVCVWNMSIKILLEAILGCHMSYRLLKIKDIMYFDIENMDGLFGIKKFVELSILNVSGGIYYFGVVIATVITDHLLFYVYGVEHAFYKIKWLGVVVIVICIWVIAMLIMPLADIQKIWENEKERYIKKNKHTWSAEEKKNILSIETSILKLSYNKLPIIVAVVGPVSDIVIRVICSLADKGFI